MKKLLSITFLLFMIGCGGNSDSSNTPNTDTNNDLNVNKNVITVLDEYIIKSTVLDGNNIPIGVTNNKGIVETKRKNIKYPLKAIGGHLDSNLNEQLDINDIPNNIVLIANKGNVIDPITTLLSKGVKEDKLSGVLNVNKSLFYSDPYKMNNLDLIKVNQMIYPILTNDSLVDKLKDEINRDLPMLFKIAQNEKGIKLFAKLLKSLVNDNIYHQYIDLLLNISSLEELENSIIVINNLKEQVTSIISKYNNFDEKGNNSSNDNVSLSYDYNNVVNNNKNNNNNDNVSYDYNKNSTNNKGTNNVNNDFNRYDNRSSSLPSFQ